LIINSEAQLHDRLTPSVAALVMIIVYWAQGSERGDQPNDFATLMRGKARTW